MAVAGPGGRHRAAGGMGPLRPLPPRHDAAREDGGNPRGDCRGGAGMRLQWWGRLQPVSGAARTPHPQARRPVPMSFDHPWILLALLLPLGWAAWEWRESARRLALGLKTAAFVCIVLALSGPRVVVYQTKVAVAVLADTSASLSPEDLARESAIASEVERGRGRHWTRIMPFARSTRAGRARREGQGWLEATPHRGDGGARDGSGVCHPRRRGGAARGHGAAPAADLRRQ